MASCIAPLGRTITPTMLLPDIRMLVSPGPRLGHVLFLPTLRWARANTRPWLEM